MSSSMPKNDENHNADLTLWIYEKDEWREALLRNCMFEKLITVKTEGKKVMHATSKYALNVMNRNDDNCPILLVKMTFNIFSHYMSMKSSNNSGVYLSATSYGGIRIEITHMYCVSGNEMYQGFKRELYQLISGMKRAVVSNNRQDGISIEEGKKATIFDVYKILCYVLHQV